MHVGDDLQSGIRTALASYLTTAAKGHGRIDAPRFEGEAGGEIRGLSLEIAVDANAEAALRAEARRQGISLSRLAAHSVYLYLAQLELG